MITPLSLSLEDQTADRVARNHADAISELQALPCVGLKVIGPVQLKDGVETPIAHGLGRKPLMTWHSPPRGAAATGRIEEVRSGSYDREKLVVYKATGWGATITVDVAVL